MARAHCSIHAFILACIAALAIAGAAACDNTARGVKQDAEKAEAETRDERAKASQTAREIGDRAADTAQRAAGAAAQAGEELAERAGAAAQTVDIKTALMADPGVDATRIDVDTNARTRTVTLNGMVPTVGERERAEKIAKEKASSYTVVNNLAVAPRS